SAQDHSKDFMEWFRDQIDLKLREGQDIIPDNIKWLSKGPSYVAKKYSTWSLPWSALESAQHGEGDNSKDPYSQVIPEPKRKSRVRLVGSGVTKNDFKKRDKGSSLIFPEEMKDVLVKQLLPSLATAILSQLQEANPGMNIVIPESLTPSTPRDASSAPHHVIEQNGLSTKSGATVSQQAKDAAKAAPRAKGTTLSQLKKRSVPADSETPSNFKKPRPRPRRPTKKEESQAAEGGHPAKEVASLRSDKAELLKKVLKQDTDIVEMVEEGKRAAAEILTLQAQLQEYPQIKEAAGQAERLQGELETARSQVRTLRERLHESYDQGEEAVKDAVKHAWENHMEEFDLAWFQRRLEHSAAVLAVERLGLPPPEFVPSDEEDDAAAP
ncbi:hypothetical protein SOVF_073310, partial [Spinacia oleracea]